MVVFDFGRGVLVKAKLYKGDEYLVKDSTAFKFEKELSKGYIAEIDANEGAYALVSADLEVEVEAEEEPVEADKANPETGAADFVGAAVAMAVVSVAAAGALALKK
jgi:hypothetical protein